MRWVVCHPGPAFSVHDVYAGWVEALQNLGQRVISYNLDDRLTFYGSVLRQIGENTFKHACTPEQSYDLAINGLYATLYQARPDVLLVISGMFVPVRVLDRARRSGTRIVIVHTESPYEDERQIQVAPYADLNIVNDPTNIERFKAVGPTWYLPQAYRSSVHTLGDPRPELECDLAFVGTAYPSRVAFFEALDLAGLDVFLGGNWTHLDEDSPLLKYVGHDLEDCLDNADVVDVYRSARCGINTYRQEAQRPELSTGWAMGPREVEMAACGLFYLREARGEGDEVLDMLPTFTSPQEASELLRYWLDRPDERAVLAEKARHAIADRTFDQHAARLLRLLDT